MEHLRFGVGAGISSPSDSPKEQQRKQHGYSQPAAYAAPQQKHPFDLQPRNGAAKSIKTLRKHTPVLFCVSTLLPASPKLQSLLSLKLNCLRSVHIPLYPRDCSRKSQFELYISSPKKMICRPHCSNCAWSKVILWMPLHKTGRSLEQISITCRSQPFPKKRVQ